MKLLKPKSFKEFKEKERELENQAKKPKRNKVFNAIQIDEFDTDESMRKLDKSDLDNESDASYRNGESPGNKDDSNNLEKERRKKEKEKIFKLEKLQQTIQNVGIKTFILSRSKPKEI